MEKVGKRGFKRIISASFCSATGLVTAWRREAAFRQELLLAAFLIPIAIYLGDSGLERAVLIGSVLIVLVAELLNSGIEAVVDRTGLEYNELSKYAKDMGSAAVFIALVNVVVMWGLILWR